MYFIHRNFGGVNLKLSLKSMLQKLVNHTYREFGSCHGFSDLSQTQTKQLCPCAPHQPDSV